VSGGRPGGVGLGRVPTCRSGVEGVVVISGVGLEFTSIQQQSNTELTGLQITVKSVLSGHGRLRSLAV
jgi:hypothetical protein